MKKRFLSLVLIVLQISPAWAAKPPIGTSLGALGIRRVGELGLTNETAYSLLERRLLRWVENMDRVSVDVKRIATPVASEILTLEEAKFKLADASTRLQRMLLKGKTLGKEVSTLVDSIHQQRQLLSGLSQLGPALQRSLVVEGAYWWKLGKKKEMHEVLVRAARIHPQGKLEGLGEWDSSESLGNIAFNTDAFEAILSKVRSEIPRNCKIQVITEPPFAQLSVNGFSLGNQRELVLSGKSIHHLSFSAPGFEKKEELVRCDRIGNRRLQVRMEPGREKQREIAGIHSFILVKPMKDQFRLFLFTPSNTIDGSSKGAIDEIPLIRPIRVAELLMENGEANLPVSSDAMIDLFQKHRLAFNQKLGGVTETVNWDSSRGRSESQIQSSSPWYKSPVFWGIVGGVIAGGAITYFATRSQGPDANASGAEAKIGH